MRRRSRRAGEARAHTLCCVVTGHNFAILGGECLCQFLASGTDHSNDTRNLELQMARGLHGDRNAVRQLMAQLVGTEAGRGACREQQADDVQVCLTSHAEGSKRRSGFAAQDGSFTPWRTAVISARIATAISGGVFEPMYRPTGPRRRAISSAETSNSFSRSRRASLFFFEPMAPT